MPRQPHVPDELDLALINAMQISPRAPWAKVGAALDIDPGTALRRWTRLVDEGSAWLTADPGTPRGDRMWLAFVEVDCSTDHALGAAMVLARHPGIATVDHVTGGHDLCLTVFTSDLGALSGVLLDDVARIPGVLATRRYLATHIYVEASKWELGALDPEQRRALRATGDATAVGAPIPDVDVRELMHAMGEDCRISISDLAVRLGVGRATARRRLETALAHRQLVIRCEMSHAVAGTPVAATLRTVVPPVEQTAIARAIAGMPQTRFCAGLTGGPSNLLLSFWVRSLADLQQVEVVLAERFPQLHVQDRVITLRTLKRFGRIISSDGQATAEIILDPWDMAPAEVG